MITPGTILIDKDKLRPHFFAVEGDMYPDPWMSVKPSMAPSELEEELAASGWTISYVPGEVRTTAFGVDRRKIIHRAMKRLIRSASIQNCNCLEIQDLETQSFLGLTYLTVSAHLRVVQMIPAHSA